MNRRGFLRGAGASVLAAFVAPVFIPSGRLDFGSPRSILGLDLDLPPKLWGDGIHDDTAALRWLFDHHRSVDGMTLLPVSPERVYRLTETLVIPSNTSLSNLYLIGDYAKPLVELPPNTRNVSITRCRLEQQQARTSTPTIDVATLRAV